MLIPSALLTKSGVAIENVAITDEYIIAVVVATRGAVPCPLCGYLAHRVHSRYHRTVADLPSQGMVVRLELQARRFCCDEPTCLRRIFAERFPDLVAAGARRSMRLHALYLALGLVLGSEAGARLATELGLSISPDTVLRATTTSSPAEHPTPRVLGVDDWVRPVPSKQAAAWG